MYKVEVGMQVYLVPTDARRGKPFYETVVKIGRKWATTDRNSRFDIGMFEGNGKAAIDGGIYSPSHKAYANKEMHDREVSFEKLKWRIQDVFTTHGEVRKLTLEQLVQVADILGIEHDVGV